jgi:peptidoglycan/xylan/chitin deacetylase (PgdA/CDA1 family)
VLVAAAYEFARLLHLPWLGRRLARGAVILCYHNVVTGRDAQSRDGALHIGVDAFASQMRWLSRHFDVVSLDVVLQRLRARQPTRGLAALTFDDGYTGYFRSALPVLRSLKLPSAVFIVADAAERGTAFWWDHPVLVKRGHLHQRQRWLTEAQGLGSAIYRMEGVTGPGDVPPDLLPAVWSRVRHDLGPDVTVGCHTTNHLSLPSLDPSALHAELAHGAALIEQHLGMRPRWLAYPYGAWNRTVRDAAAAVGYDAALTLEPGRVGPRDDLLALPRVNIPGGIRAAAFACWASGLLPPQWLRR